MFMRRKETSIFVSLSFLEVTLLHRCVYTYLISGNHCVVNTCDNECLKLYDRLLDRIIFSLSSTGYKFLVGQNHMGLCTLLSPFPKLALLFSFLFYFQYHIFSLYLISFPDLSPSLPLLHL